MSILDFEIAKLARDNYLIAGLREKVSLWTEDELLLVYSRLLAVYDSAYIENVDLKNKPKALKLFHKSINLLGMGHLAHFSDAMLDPHKASRIFSALDDKITARYGKGTAQRNRNIMKLEDNKCKKNPKQQSISTTNEENIPPTNSNHSVSAAPKWEVVSQEKFIMGSPAATSNNIHCPNVIPVPPKGREIQRTPLRQSKDSLFVISPPNPFKTPSVIVSKCSISEKIIPAGSRIPRTPEGEVMCDSTIDENLKFDSLTTGRQLPRTPENSDISNNLPIKGMEIARTPVGNISDANDLNNVRETLEIPPKRMELSRTPVNVSTETVESNNKRSTFDLPVKGNQLVRTPPNDCIQTNDVLSNKRSTFDISAKGNQLARTPTSTNDSIQANTVLTNRRSTFDIPVKGKELDNKPISGGSQIKNVSPSEGGQLVKSTNLSAENIIPKGRQLIRTPNNCDNSIDDNKICMNSTYVQNKDSEDRRNTFGVQLPSSDTTFDVFEPPIQFCNDESDLISPPSDFAIPSSSIVISKSKSVLTEIDRRGSYVHEKCSVSDRRETFTVESDDRRGTFTVKASHDDSIFQKLDKNYVGPVPKRKEKHHCLSDDNETFKSVDANDTFILKVDSKNIKDSNSPKENMADETFTINQTRERLNTEDLSFFDPLADETIKSGRHSLMVKTSDNKPLTTAKKLDEKPLTTAKKLDEKPLLTAYTPEMASDTQAKRVSVSKNCIPKGRKQLPRTPTGTDDLIDLKNESSETGSGSFVVGDLTIEIFVKDKKRDSIQVDQKSTSNSRGSIGAMVKKLDSNIDANSSSLSNTPQKCTPAFNMETPVCSEIRNQDKKKGNISKNILQKNVKNHLQNKLDTINDEEDDESLDIFYKKTDNSSNIKDKKANIDKLSTDNKLQIIERQSEEKACESNKLENKPSKIDQCQEKITTKVKTGKKHNDEINLVDKKSNGQKSSENVTNNQLENLKNNKKVLEENHRETDKKCKEKESTKEIKHSKEQNKSNERENVDKKTIKEVVVEKMDEKYSDLKDIKETKNNVNKNEKDILDVAKVSENKGQMDLEDYINLHKKPALKNFKIPKVNKQEKVEGNKRPEQTKPDDETIQSVSANTDKQVNKQEKVEGNKRPEQTKSDDETIQSVSANTDKQGKDSKNKLQTLKDSELDKNMKSNESESNLKMVKKSSKEEKLKSALDILISDLNDSSDFNDSLEIFPLKKNKIYKSNKKCEGVTESEGKKLEKDNKDMHKYVKDASRDELANEKESIKESAEDSNKFSSKDKSKAKKEIKISKHKKEAKENKKNSKTTEVDQTVADKMENLIEQTNETKEHVPKNEVIYDNILEPITDISNKVLCLKKPRESLGSILPTPMRELLRNDENVIFESTRNQDLLTTPTITSILVKDESNSQVKSDDTQRNTLKTNSRGKGRKLNVDLQTDEIIDKSKALTLKVPIKKPTKERKNVISDHEIKTDKDTAMEQEEKKMDQNKDEVLSRTGKRNNEPTENIPDEEKKLIDAKPKDSNKILDKFDKKASDDLDAKVDSSSTLVQLAKKLQSKPVQRRGKNARLSIEVIVKKNVDKENSINESSQLELSLEESKLSKNLKESTSEVSNSKENKKVPSIEKRGRSKTKIETDLKDVEKVEADDKQVAKTSTKPVSKRDGKVTEVQLEESTQQVANTTKKPVAKRGRKVTEVQLDESTQQVEKVASTTKKPVIKRGRKVTDVQLEESTQQVELVANTITKSVVKRGRKATEVQLEKSTQQDEQVASTITKPVTKRGRKVTEVQLEKSTLQVEQGTITTKKPVAKEGRKASEVQMEESTQQVEQVASTSSKPVIKRGRKAAEVQLEKSTLQVEQGTITTKKPVAKKGRKASEVQLEESTQQVEQVASTSSKPVLKRGRKATEVQLEESTQQVASTSTNPVTKRGRKVTEVQSKESTQPVEQVASTSTKPATKRGRKASEIQSEESTHQMASTSTKPVTKRGRKVTEVQLEESTLLVNEKVLKPPSRGGKSRQNLNTSSVSKADETISLSNKPTPKGSRRASLLNKSTTNTSISLDTKNPKSRRGRAAVLEEPNPSELTNSKPSMVSEASNSKPVRGRRNVNAKLEVTTVDKEQSKARGGAKQVKSNVSDAKESNTEILTKKENQKLKVTKENKSLPLKENIKASTKNKRQQMDDSHSSPDKKRKVEKLPENKSTAENVRNTDVLTNVDKRRKASKETLDTSSVENIKSVRRKASTETLDTSSVEDIKPVRGRKRTAKMTDVECSPVKKGKVLKNAETKCNANVSVSAVPSGRGSRKCKTAAATAIKDIANDTVDISLTKRKSRKI